MPRPRKDGTPAQGKTGGQKPYEATDEKRAMAEKMAGLGIPQDQIAMVMGISDVTLRKYYRDQLDVGVAKANSLVAQNLFNIATSKETGAVAAGIFWMKTRGGWRETVRQEHVGPDGGAIQIERKPVVDWQRLSPEAREAAKVVLLELKAQQEGGRDDE